MYMHSICQSAITDAAAGLLCWQPTCVYLVPSCLSVFYPQCLVLKGSFLVNRTHLPYYWEFTLIFIFSQWLPNQIMFFISLCQHPFHMAIN